MRISRPKYSRGEILAILCTGERTADELAEELGISSPAVRKSLARLEEDGLVRYDAVRRSAKKPAHVYRITATGELSLSRAYLPLLQKLLRAQEARLSSLEVEEMLRATGRSLAPDRPGDGMELGARLEEAVSLLRGLGATASTSEEEGVLAIRCGCCAIAAVVAEHPLACKAMEAMLSEYVGHPMVERCDRSGRPSCRFEVTG